ncbi:hypothetical protein [Parasitella parasitica]|uniref:Uncharacterized protein n=1 Tax=Parasitella parasitica TaxID=35722 RepID=A0A0B7NKD3_9FUNG|nr:hypothetical protein [Parasitella parasitica]
MINHVRSDKPDMVCNIRPEDASKPRASRVALDKSWGDRIVEVLKQKACTAYSNKWEAYKAKVKHQDPLDTFQLSVKSFPGNKIKHPRVHLKQHMNTLFWSILDNKNSDIINHWAQVLSQRSQMVTDEAHVEEEAPVEEEDPVEEEAHDEVQIHTQVQVYAAQESLAQGHVSNGDSDGDETIEEEDDEAELEQARDPGICMFDALPITKHPRRYQFHILQEAALH